MTKRRKRGEYTPLGQRIMGLAGTQRRVAEALGKCQQAVSSKLRGLTEFSLSDLRELADYFEVHVSYFLEEE